MKTWYVYILELSNGFYYTGITNDVCARMKAHSIGKGSKYVRSFLPFCLIYLEKSKDRSCATKREIKIKKFSKRCKIKLCSDKNNLATDGEWAIYTKGANNGREKMRM